MNDYDSPLSAQLDLSDELQQIGGVDVPEWAGAFRVATYRVLAKEWPDMKLESLFLTFGLAGNTPCVVTTCWHYHRPWSVLLTIANLHHAIAADGMEFTAKEMADSFFAKLPGWRKYR